MIQLSNIRFIIISLLILCLFIIVGSSVLNSSLSWLVLQSVTHLYHYWFLSLYHLRSWTPLHHCCFLCMSMTMIRYICVQGMTLNCIHIFIVTGSFLYWCVMRPASQRFFIYSCIYLQILIISYLATFLGTNSLSVLMCRKAVNQSIVLILNHGQSSKSKILFLFCRATVKFVILRWTMSPRSFIISILISHPTLSAELASCRNEVSMLTFVKSPGLFSLSSYVFFTSSSQY